MPDIPAIVAAVNGPKAATDIVRYLRDAQTAFDRADLKFRIAELVDALADAKMSLSDVQDALNAKDAEIQRLTAALKLKAELVRHRDAYYQTDAQRQPTGDPYCSQCFEVRHVAVHIHQHPRDRSRSVCPACKNEFAWQRRLPLATSDA